MTAADARRIALSLPDVEEKDHHGRASFRLRGRILATIPDPTHLNVMLDPVGIEAAVDHTPAACDRVYWGEKLAAVGVDLSLASPALVTELLTAAHLRRGG